MKIEKVYDKKFVIVQCAMFKKVEAARTKEDSKETDRQRRLKRIGNGFPHFAQGLTLVLFKAHLSCKAGCRGHL